MAQPRHVFETYIKASQDRIWQALIDPELTSRYFFDAPRRVDMGRGRALPLRDRRTRGRDRRRGHRSRSAEAARAVVSRAVRRRHPAEPASRVTWEITPVGSVCRLTCIHTDLFGAPKTWAATADGWNVVLNSMKTLLETGDALGEIPDDGGSPFVSAAPPDEQWHRSLGVECNNGTYDLLEREDRTAAETQTMIDMAHAAKYHWGKVGTPVNQVRGDYLCSRVLRVRRPRRAGTPPCAAGGRRSRSPRPRRLRPRVRPRGTCTRARLRGRRRRRQKRARRGSSDPDRRCGGPRDLRSRPREGAVVRRRI